MSRECLRLLAFTTALASGVLATDQAWAQSQPAPDEAQSEAKGLVDIVVTAQRREQDLQSVPGSVAVLTGDDLQKSQITDIRQVLISTPNIAYSQFRSNEPTIYIRGIGPFLNTVGLERPTGFYVDDVYVGGSGVAGLGTLFGMERVEILRGPQGTLFGRNVTAGVLQYITKDPSQKSEGTVALSYGNYDAKQLQAYVNGGLSENISANLAASWNLRDGFARNLSTGDELENEDAIALRGKIGIDFGDTTQLIVSGDYFLRDTNGVSRVSARINNNGSPSPNPRAAVQPIGAVNYGPGAIKLESWGASARLKSELSFGNLTAIAAYREYFARDFSVTQSRVDADPRFNIPASPISVITDNAVDQNQVTLELRLDNSTDKFDYVAGLFFIEENLDGNTIFNRSNNGGATLAVSTFSDAPLTARSYAAFADGIYHITPELSVGGGLRYTYDKKTVSFSPRNLLTNAVIFTRDNEFSDGELTWRSLIQYQPTSDLNIYANYARGFKSGGFDTETTALAGSNAIESETIDSYEAGIKTNLFDNRLRFNVAAFYSELKGYQISALDPVSLTVRSFNAGNIRSRGFEVDFAALITDEFQISGGYGYTKANYISDIIAGGENINGNRVQRTPRHTVSIAASYEKETPIGTFELRSDFAYASRMEGNERNQVQNQHPSYTTTNASISWTSNDDAWNVLLWGRNITNELIVRQITSISVNQVGAIYDAPRTYGVTLTRNF